ncbi:MAG: metal-sulfur cluster assembly factor, partial [Kiritimatiellia bacterium]|nr:metal-sulfur cluster assembly factor [Kiritimatiellia bacterium]
RRSFAFGPVRRTFTRMSCASTTENTGGPGPMQNAAENRAAGEIWNALQRVIDPDLHVNIVDLGLVYGVEVSGETAAIRMTLTSPGCPYGPYILHEVKTGARRAPGIKKVRVDLVWDPAWSPALMSEEIRLQLGFDV